MVTPSGDTSLVVNSHTANAVSMVCCPTRKALFSGDGKPLLVGISVPLDLLSRPYHTPTCFRAFSYCVSSTGSGIVVGEK